MNIDTTKLDEFAWYNNELPKNSDRLEMIYYHMTRSIYASVKNGTVALGNAKALKAKLVGYFENIVDLACSSGRLITELNKLTAPSADLRKKKRDELLEIVLKMSALCSGLMSRAEQEVPEMLTGGKYYEEPDSSDHKRR